MRESWSRSVAHLESGGVLVVLSALIGVPSNCVAAELGPIVAVREFAGPSAGVLGKGLPDMLITDLAQVKEPCELTIVSWGKDRAAVVAEQEFQQSAAVDPDTRVATGQLLQPDVFVDGSVTLAGGHATWSVKVSDAFTGEVLGKIEGSAPQDKLFEGEQELAKQLAVELCKARPGFVLKGKMDDATITGFVCGDLSKPFTASSPEVAGTWTFTPSDKTSGAFSYKAANVGGVPGKGSGTYKVLPGAEGSRRIQLKGSGSIISPVGTFSAPITESLTLTPAASCKRTGNR